MNSEIKDKERTLLKFIKIFLISNVLVSCISINRDFGYFPVNKDIKTLEVGKSNKIDVKKIIGSAAVVDDNSWIYISSKVKATIFFDPSVTERNILLLEFDNNNVLLSKETFTLADGKIFDIHNSQEIDDPRKIGALRQLFGNITNFSSESFVINN